MTPKTRISMQKLDDLRSKNKSGMSNNQTSGKNNDLNQKKPSLNPTSNKNSNSNNSFNIKQNPADANSSESAIVKDAFNGNINDQPKDKSDQKVDKSNNDKQSQVDSARISLLQTQLQVQKQEVDDWKNKTLRLGAELQNLQKQNELDLLQSKKSGKKSVMNLLLPFINTINLAFSFKPNTEDVQVDKFINTIKSSFDKLCGDLQGIQVEIIVPEREQEFDPMTMTALNQASDADDKIIVKQVVGVGMKIDNQLVQSANVMV